MLKGEIRGQGMARQVLSPSKWSGRLDRIQATRNTDRAIPPASGTITHIKRARPTCYVDGQFK